jgi:hypothetical protein
LTSDDMLIRYELVEREEKSYEARELEEGRLDFGRKSKLMPS